MARFETQDGQVVTLFKVLSDPRSRLKHPYRPSSSSHHPTQAEGPERQSLWRMLDLRRSSSRASSTDSASNPAPEGEVEVEVGVEAGLRMEVETEASDDTPPVSPSTGADEELKVSIPWRP